MTSLRVLAGLTAGIALGCTNRALPHANLASEAAATAVYDLDVKVDPGIRSMVVTGTAVLPPTTAAQRSLGFTLLSPVHDLRIAVVEPRAAAGVLAPSVLGPCTWQCDYEAALPSTIEAGQPIKLTFSYRAGDKTGFVFRIGGSDASFANESNTAWYPAFGPVLPRDGKRTVDGSADMVGAIRLDIPRELTAVATGAELEVVERGDRKHYTYRVARPLAGAFAIAAFTVLRSPGELPVALYTLGGVKEPAAMLAGIRAVVDQLTAIYGPFPFPSFSLVELSNDSVAGNGFGGAGCAGFMLSSTSYLETGFNTAFFGHEIGHQWWGNIVTHATETEGNFLLDEALAQYGSLYTVRRLEGDAAAERYRVSGYPGYVATQSGGTYLAMSLAGHDARLGELPAEGPLGHELADEKGFLVFDMLRQEIGADAFHRALRDVVAIYAHRGVTWRAFRDTIERAAGRDLAWFWDQWYQRLGAPMLDVTWTQQSGAIVGTITQTQPAYRMKLPLELRDASGHTETKIIELSQLATPFRFEHATPATAVDIDPHFETLHYTPALAAAARARVDEVAATWRRMTQR